METHMARFRVKLTPNRTPNSSQTRKRLPTGEHACERCRQQRKKCSKTPPECDSCTTAGVRCSLGEANDASTETADLQARLAWMEDFINQTSVLKNHTSIRDVATGTNLLRIADPAPSSPCGTAATQRSSVPDNGLVGGEIASPEVALLNEDDGPLAKRPRIDSSGRAPKVSGRMLVDAYFNDTNRAYPFVDRDRVLAILEAKGSSVLQTPDGDADSQILYLVMAIGHATLLRTGQVSADVVPRFQVKYVDILSKCMEQESTESVLILLLLAIYSLTDCHGCSTWSILDTVTRQATRLGLTRREIADEGLSTSEAEQNHRLFWSLYVFDRMHAASTGMPVALCCVQSNIPLPGLTIEEFASPKRMEFTSMLQVTRHIIHLRQLEDRVLHQIHLRDESRPEEMTSSFRRNMIISLRTEIEDWYSNGCLLKSSEVEGSIHITIPWLAARYYNLLLLLYYPSSHSPITSEISKSELVSIAQKHIQSNSLRYQQRHLPLNEATLCRVFLVAMAFLYCFLSHDANEALLGAKVEIAFLADVMASYPTSWTKAHRAAAILNQLVALVTATCTKSSRSIGLSEADEAWCHAIHVSMVELSHQIFGRGTAYQLRDPEQGFDKTAGSRAQNVQNASQIGPTPGYNGFFLESVESLELPLGGIDTFANGLSFMDLV